MPSAFLPPLLGQVARVGNPPPRSWLPLRGEGCVFGAVGELSGLECLGGAGKALGNCQQEGCQGSLLGAGQCASQHCFGTKLLPLQCLFVVVLFPFSFFLCCWLWGFLLGAIRESVWGLFRERSLRGAESYLLRDCKGGGRSLKFKFILRVVVQEEEDPRPDASAIQLQ